MKKFFIFLFSVFLITFMGCSPATGEIPEETFEIVALDEDGEVIAGLNSINAAFHRVSKDDGQIYPFFYKYIKINDIEYTVKANNYYIDNSINMEIHEIIDTNGNIIQYVYTNNIYCFCLSAANPPNFKDFCIDCTKYPICFNITDNLTVEISFSDLYEEVVQ